MYWLQVNLSWTTLIINWVPNRLKSLVTELVYTKTRRPSRFLRRRFYCAFSSRVNLFERSFIKSTDNVVKVLELPVDFVKYYEGWEG